MPTFSLLLAALSTLLLVTGCPNCSWPGDPNAPVGNENFNEGNANGGNANGGGGNSNGAGNENTNAGADPATLSGVFAGDIAGTYAITLDGAVQPALARENGFWVELDAGGLVGLKPYGPSVWRFGWAPAAEVTNVGDTASPGMMTITSALYEQVTLTEYSIDGERIRITIEMSFQSHWYSVVQARIEGTSVQHFELWPEGGGLRAVTTGSFDYFYTPGIPTNEGPTVHYVEEFSGEGVLGVGE
ncbi:MAG: hypothetical protein AMXMBFR47_21950 [Planctomycetota bacterium]